MEVTSEVHFEEGEIHGFVGKEVVKSARQAVVEHIAKEQNKHKNGWLMKSARIQGLCVKSLVECMIGGICETRGNVEFG